MKSTRMLAISVLALGLAVEVVKADFTFGTPTNLGPPINTEAEEAHTNISTDGLSLYFSSAERSGGRGKKDIWVARRATTNDDWTAPENLGPPVNGSDNDADPGISADGLVLFFGSDRGGGSGAYDLWMTTRATINSEWSNPVNLGPTVNSSAGESSPRTSTDGLSLFFHSYRTGGQGDRDLWMTTRATTDDDWATAVNLGPTVNSSDLELNPSISVDGLCLFFSSNRPGGYSGMDLYVTMRPTINHSWGIPVNLGAVINEGGAGAPYISSDGLTLHFTSVRAGGFGLGDLWQAPVIPIVDFNGDGIVDSADMCIMVDYWGTDEPLCDIGPIPWGDAIVDVQDMIVLAEHLFEEMSDPTLVAHWALDETEASTAYDKAGANNASVFGGAAWQPTGGMIGGALQLDGVDDWVFSRSVQNLGEELFSILAWIKGGAPNQVVISQPLVAGWLMADSEGRLMTELGDTDPSGGPLVSGAVITDGEWHRIGLVRDGLHRKLYVDGVTVAEDSQAGPGISDSGLNIGVGKNYMPGTYWSGLIDDVRIYNRAVTP